MAKSETAANLQDLSYEEAYSALEETLQTLEAGDLPLDQALALYERGAILAKYCAEKLDEAELRVRQWQDGEAEPFSDWSDE